MVDITIDNNAVYKPTYNWGAPPCRLRILLLFIMFNLIDNIIRKKYIVNYILLSIKIFHIIVVNNIMC